jgi:ATP-dependent DNA ligase
MKPIRAYIGTLRDLENNPDWWMEAKIDGWRGLFLIDENNKPSIWTRQKRQLVMPYNLVDQAEEIARTSKPLTLYDTEFYNIDKRGSWTDHPEVHCKLEMFDILYRDGKYLGENSQENRRALLETIIKDSQDICLAKKLDVSEENWANIWNLATNTEWNPGNKVRPASDWTKGHVHGVVLKQKSGKRHDSPKNTKENIAWIKLTIPQFSIWNSSK